MNLVNQAQFALSIGQAENALTLANRVLAADPHHVGVLEIIAHAQWKLQHIDDLLVTLEKLTELYPYEPGYHELRGAALQSKGDLNQATKAFERAAELTDDCGPATFQTPETLDWNRRVLAQLLTDDEVFRISYKRDPSGACRQVGIPFTPDLLVPTEEFRAS